MPAAEQTDVLIVGAGPCGITLANLLGVYGVRAIVVDRDTEIVDFPRAVGIDDESLRIYQAIGCVDELLADMVQNTPIRYHTSWGRCFAHVKPSVQPFGWPRRNLFLQPLYESVLRRELARHTTVELRTGHELLDLVQDGTGVTAELKDADGGTHTVRARYLVGTDGGRSTVRRLAGVELVGTTEPVKWLVVDVADDRLDAPYSAVYCDPERPILVVPLPYGHRRFEFRLLPHESEDDIVRPERVRELLEPLYGSTPLPRVLRGRVYLHHSRVAATFQVDRVFLAGDAAHLQPPFFGQGMNSGIRDAGNLAWKLAAVVTGRADDSMLAGYDSERRGHATEMVEFATRIGRMYRPRNAVTERLRDVAFRGLRLIPGANEYILQMKYKPMPRYTDGVVVDAGADGSPVGRMFPQPVVERPDGTRAKLDDAIGPWFTVLGIHTDPSRHLSEASRAWWEQLGARFVTVRAPRSEHRELSSAARSRRDADTATDAGYLEDVDGAFRDRLLEHPDEEIIVLRPDRYVAAVCTRDAFESVTTRLRRVISGG